MLSLVILSNAKNDKRPSVGLLPFFLKRNPVCTSVSPLRATEGGASADDGTLATERARHSLGIFFLWLGRNFFLVGQIFVLRFLLFSGGF